MPVRVTIRVTVAVAGLRLVNRLSRLSGRGSGTVAGGRVGLAIDHRLLADLTTGRPVAVVSGTNGKTTTTRMLATALTVPGGPPVVSNETGANMPEGHVAALAGSAPGAVSVLEVDEGYLGRVIEEVRPRVVVLLNLSRDQLDRIAEVRMLVDRWRSALGRLPVGGPAPTVVVANGDDPMVTWAASAAPQVVWVGAGQVWRNDAVGCPGCGGRIEFGTDDDWWCDRCDFRRPDRAAWLEGSTLVLAGGTRLDVDIALPGQFNRANAAMVAMAAPAMAAPPLSPAEALARIATVDEVAGRFAATMRRGRPVRLLLAKNPAGWTAIFDLLEETGPASVPLVLSINARVADGHDPSWLWDVPFERLAGRDVVVTGDRRRDLAVRLHYAEVACTVIDDPLDAVDHAIAGSQGSTTDALAVPPVDFLGNYTAFAELRRRL